MLSKTLKKDYSTVIENFFNKSKINFWLDICFLITFVMIAIFMFGPNLGAKWWIQDDHEIVYYMGSDKAINVSEIIPTIFTKTELNPASNVIRYRPVYIILRMIETRLWYQYAPFGWYFFRLIVFILFISAVYIFSGIIIGRLLGGFLSVYLTSFPLWSDIFGRLGTAEVYTIIGTTVFISGVILALKSRYKLFSLILMSLGVIVSIGSKENMIILLIPLFYISFFYKENFWKSKTLPILSTLFCTTWTFWVYIKIFQKLQINNIDGYNNSLNTLTRFQIVVTYLIEHKGLFLIIIGLLLIAVIAAFLKKNQNFALWFKTTIVTSFFIIILIISQIYFYSGQLLDRYNFPFILYIPFALILTIFEFRIIFALSNKKVFEKAFMFVCLLIMVLVINPQNWQKTHELSVSNVDRSIVFMDKVKQIERFLSSNPKLELIIYGNEAAMDFEPILSYSRFINAEGLENKIFIIRDPDENFESTYKGLALTLEQQLLGYSKNGFRDWGISPIKEISNDADNCLLLTLLTNHPSPLKCNNIIDGNLFIK